MAPPPDRDESGCCPYLLGTCKSARLVLSGDFMMPRDQHARPWGGASRHRFASRLRAGAALAVSALALSACAVETVAPVDAEGHGVSPALQAAVAPCTDCEYYTGTLSAG